MEAMNEVKQGKALQRDNKSGNAKIYGKSG